ncbi:glycosyltransferase [Campylobacter sp. RM12651]|uniref:glycosyltransferase n=1 Tax=Campylobacter sp. RM12651 TaxID=1660079 RepID=UPI0023BAE141|nr:glycosyltransferase [Campylobacter sp. RM12651]ULO03512.1 two domain glycosyltransferase [Campylobacter sp. RM12651]
MSDFLSMTLSENQIIVKNAEGDPDTKATILIKNKIDYIPKVSVIIPVYNTEKYLRECLDSVINQSLKEIEIICVDDGSTDNSLEILKEYAAKDNRIFVVSRINCGVGYSRNEGIQKAKGEFLAFIDPDDYYPDNNVILILYQKAILNNVLICGGSLLIYDENKKECYQKDNNKDLFKYDGIMDYSDYQFDYGFQRFIYSRKMVLKNNIFFPNYKRYQDPIFMIKAMDCAKKIYVVKSHTYTYRMEHKTVTWDNSRVIDILNAFLEILDYTNKNNLNKLYDLSLMRLKKEYWGKIKNVDNDDINLVKQKLVELSLKRYCKIYTNLEKAKVSIIIPIFNVSKYLQECLNSITSQTFDYIEIICVNDGSSDNSLDILNDFANRHRNIKIIDKINTGYGNSMNCGLRVANSEYIGIVEPDDFIALDMYKRLYKVAKENDLDVLKSNYYIYKNNVSTLNKVINDNCYNKIFNGVNDKDKLGFVINPTGIFKKVFLDSNYITFNETPGASHQDIGFDYCTTYLADKIMYLDEAFYYYRQDNEEASMFKKSCVYTIFLEQQHVFNIMKKNSKFQYLYNILLLRKYNSYIYFYKNRISLKDRGIFRKLLKDECMQDKIFSVDLIDIKVVEQIKNIVFSKNYIPVIFATNDYYVDYLRVALKSLSNTVNNNDEYHIFIFYSNLKKDSMDKIFNTKIKDNIYIEFIDVFNYIQQYNLYSTNHFSIEMYYRILAPEILKSYEKIIYLDCDILIKGDISEFYNIDLEGNILGAIINPVDKYEKKIKQLNMNKNEYINSGVLLIDTKNL